MHPKIVSERLGHSTVAITLDLYGHVLPGMQEEATRKYYAALRTAIEKQRHSRQPLLAGLAQGVRGRDLHSHHQLQLIDNGGGRGIRTPERVAPLTVFKTAAFNHSAIPPLSS